MVLAASADARVFAGRLTRLDPAALVRLRPGAQPGHTAVWARLPWGVLVTRQVAGPAPDDMTIAAADLLADGHGTPPRRRDGQWRGALPPEQAVALEQIPTPRVRDVAAAAAGTLRQVTTQGLAGRPVGARVLREALLDHVAVKVHVEGERLEVSQRLVQAVAQMGFLGDDESVVRVLRSGRWVGLAATYGTAWLPPPTLSLRPT